MKIEKELFISIDDVKEELFNIAEKGNDDDKRNILVIMQWMHYFRYSGLEFLEEEKLKKMDDFFYRHCRIYDYMFDIISKKVDEDVNLTKFFIEQFFDEVYRKDGIYVTYYATSI